MVAVFLPILYWDAPGPRGANAASFCGDLLASDEGSNGDIRHPYQSLETG
jgi:hypothetical protein